MIGAGLVMFMAKRRAKAQSAAAGRFYGFVDRMNVAAIGGALFACASYFWALRLLPQSLSDPRGGFPGVGVYASIRAVPLDQAARSDLELYVFWLGVGCRRRCMRCYARRTKPGSSSSRRSPRCASGCPSIGYLVPNCDIGSMIAAGDWKMVAVDLTALGIGLALAWRGVEDERQARRRARWQSGGRSRSVAGGLMYLLSALLCAYAGFAALCAITARNVPLVWTTPPSRGVTSSAARGRLSAARACRGFRVT